MNKYIYYLFIILLTFTACVDHDDITDYIAVNVKIEPPAELMSHTDLQGHQVILTSETQQKKAVTDAEGIAHFSQLLPNIYTVSASWNISSQLYQQITGDKEINNGVTITGSLNNQLITDKRTINLPLLISVNRDILISKIYYSGSKDRNNRNYLAGKYIELYNQSSNETDVAGLYIGLLESEGNQAYTLDNLHDNYADSVVLLKQVFRIPNNQPHKVAPGATILLTNSAIDHTGGNDNEDNLLSADFEAKDQKGTYQNNPDIPALEVSFLSNNTISYMNMVQSGPCGIVIFRTDEDINTWPLTYRYGKTTGSQWLLLPKRYIIDGVDILRNKNTGVDIKSKRLYQDIDGGYTNINSASGWSHEIIYRRTSRTIGSQRILMDTNNSTNDFKVSTTIKPREYDKE